MIFRYPWLLLLLLLIPVLLYLRYSTRRPKAFVQFSDGETLQRLPSSWRTVFQPALPILYALGCAFLIMAIARPQRGLAESKTRTEAVDIVLLLDLSTSMRAIDFSTATEEIDRLKAAKRVIERFVKNRPNDRIGMVAFAALPYAASPLTLDHGWLLERMNQLETGMLEDGTAIGTAMASAVNRLRESKAKSKLIILLTDGVNNRGELSPDNAAEAAKALGIKIYTIGAGTQGIVKTPVQDPFGGVQYVRQRSEIDEVTLQKIAKTTGAMYFPATDMDSLKEVYDQIDKMEKTEIEVEQYTRFEEKFMPFVILALLCLVLEKILALSTFGRLP